MDCKQFIAQLVTSLAWPVTTITIIFLLRKNVLSLIERVLRVKHKDTEIEFTQAINEIQETSVMIDIADESSPADLQAELSRLHKLSKIIPRSAIIQAWSVLDREIGDILLNKNITPKGNSLRAREIMDLLRSLSLTQSHLDTFFKLRRILKSVTGPMEFELPSSEVESYIDIAINLSAVIRNKSSNLTDASSS